MIATLNANQSAITSGALTTAATLGEIVTEMLLVVFTLIFFLHGGPGSGSSCSAWSPTECAPASTWRAAAGWPRWSATSGPPPWSPSSTRWRSASGWPCSASRWPCRWPRWCSSARSSRSSARWSPAASRCSSRWSRNGPVAALIVLGIIIAVMQLEGHVLQPLLLGRAVKLHPLAVVLAIAAGLVVAGIAGALFAVPLLAVLNSGIRSLRSAADEHVDPDDVHTSAPEETGPDEPGLDRQPDLPGPDEPQPRRSRSGREKAAFGKVYPCQSRFRWRCAGRPPRSVAAGVLGEEADHFRRSVGAGRVGVRPARGPAGPDVAGAVHDPSLADRRLVAPDTVRVAGPPDPLPSCRPGRPAAHCSATRSALSRATVGHRLRGRRSAAPAGRAAATRAPGHRGECRRDVVGRPEASPECTPTAAYRSG